MGPTAGWELLAGQVYEALRVYLYKGASLQQAADCADYTRAALASPVRDLRAGNLTVFAPPCIPGHKSARKDAARSLVIELCRDGLSVYEISARLTGKAPHWAAPPSAASCARKDSPGCCAAPRRGQYQPGHLRPRHPVAGRRRPNFAALTARVHTTMAGLLLATPRVRGRKAGQLSRHRPPAHRHPPWAATPPPSSSPMTRRSRTRP